MRVALSSDCHPFPLLQSFNTALCVNKERKVTGESDSGQRELQCRRNKVRFYFYMIILFYMFSYHLIMTLSPTFNPST